MERTVILCDRLSPKGNGAGGNWFCSFGGRTCLWKIVLSVAVLAIIITAPLGAIGMDAAYQRLLEKEN